ncbi:hypothetical protein ASA1KI_26080 [Opitutales bacterium ASA1]|nr:hypothetical protein ASA1KI_26080 [Opitutales bacterium ASA1]
MRSRGKLEARQCKHGLNDFFRRLVPRCADRTLQQRDGFVTPLAQRERSGVKTHPALESGITGGIAAIDTSEKVGEVLASHRRTIEKARHRRRIARSQKARLRIVRHSGDGGVQLRESSRREGAFLVHRCIARSKHERMAEEGAGEVVVGVQGKLGFEFAHRIHGRVECTVLGVADPLLDARSSGAVFRRLGRGASGWGSRAGWRRGGERRSADEDNRNARAEPTPIPLTSPEASGF